ncbi:MAG: hypothetical protein NT069_16250, partial [Planctomycetota bacterium]|nr:hypothetical protein [Planctomycetota bacterium]
AEQRLAIATVEVSGPKLSLSLRGPAMRYVDRKARYALSARNEGTAETSNLKLRLQPPAGFDFASATDGGTWDPDQRVVEWFVAELRGGAVAEVSADLIARQPGAYSLDARLVTDQGGQVDAQTETVVDSTPKLVVEVVELDDPVEVGIETAWEIRLRNDGSRPSTKNRVFAELPAGVRLVEAQGPTKSATDKELVAYAALAELKPGAHAVYTIRVIGAQPGNQRIKVRVTSAEAEPIAIEETTRFYSDR